MLLETADLKIARLNSINDILLYKLFIAPLFKENIITILIEGKSGSGKSMFSLWLAHKLEQIFSQVINKPNEFDPENQVIYVPSEYAIKLDNWLYSPKITLIVDELRFLLPKHKWQSLLNQSIADANAVVRSIKVDKTGHGGILIYNTQDISDITKEARKTIHYDFMMQRLSTGVKAMPFEFWLDKRNVEKPTLRAKRVYVTINKTRFYIKAIYPPLPPTPIRKKFKELSLKSKVRMLAMKRRDIMKEVKKEANLYDIEYMLSVDDMFNTIKNLASFRKNKITFSNENKKIIMQVLNLTPSEFKKVFIPAFMKELKKRGLI